MLYDWYGKQPLICDIWTDQITHIIPVMPPSEAICQLFSEKMRWRTRLIWEWTFSSNKDKQSLSNRLYISDTVVVNYTLSLPQQLLNLIQHSQNKSRKEPIQLWVLLNYHINSKLNISLLPSKINLVGSSNKYYCPFGPDTNFPLSLSNRPLCPPSVLVIGRWGSNPGASARGSLRSVPKIKFSTLSSHQFNSFPFPSHQSPPPPPSVPPLKSMFAFPPSPSCTNSTTTCPPLTPSAALPQDTGP